MPSDMGPPPRPFNRDKSETTDLPESSKKPETPIVWTPENSFDPPFPPVEESPWYKERAAKIQAAKRQAAREEVAREQAAKQKAAREKDAKK